MEFEIAPQDDSVLFEISGDVEFDCSITKCYPTGIGDYELVTYNGDEFGFDPSRETFRVFGPGFLFDLPAEVSEELDAALRVVFDVEP